MDTVLVSDGETALQVLEEQEIDLVITDLLLPDMSGISLIKKLKSAEHNIEILVQSNLQDMDLVNTALLNGASGFITKPIDPHQVLFLSVKCLERRWLRKECSRLMLDLVIAEHKINELKERIIVTSNYEYKIYQARNGKEVIDLAHNAYIVKKNLISELPNVQN